tara:strand:- start:398 stop:952 length:555 start_codon:yes stop_codon:yes gene_type:complete
LSARRTGQSLFLSTGLSRELIKLRLLALALLNQRVGLLSASTTAAGTCRLGPLQVRIQFRCGRLVKGPNICIGFIVELNEAEEVLNWPLKSAVAAAAEAKPTRTFRHTFKPNSSNRHIGRKAVRKGDAATYKLRFGKHVGDASNRPKVFSGLTFALAHPLSKSHSNLPSYLQQEILLGKFDRGG